METNDQTKTDAPEEVAEAKTGETTNVVPETQTLETEAPPRAKYLRLL
jgi:hypothetical protein